MQVAVETEASRPRGVAPLAAAASPAPIPSPAPASTGMIDSRVSDPIATGLEAGTRRLPAWRREEPVHPESIPTWERRATGFFVRSVFMRDRRAGPWPLPALPVAFPLAFSGNSGARLGGLWFPAPEARGSVVLAHPDKRYAKHWFVREGVLDFLHEHGFNVLAFDFPGYGESDGPSRYYHEDVLAAARLARAHASDVPVHVLGVSMGAFATANASPFLDFVHGVVLESPYPNFNAWYGKGAGRVAMEAFDRAFPRTARAIQADLNVAQARPRRILVALGEEDEVTAPVLTESVARAAPEDRTTLLRVPGGRHLELFRSDAYRRAILSTFA